MYIIKIIKYYFQRFAIFLLLPIRYESFVEEKVHLFCGPPCYVLFTYIILYVNFMFSFSILNNFQLFGYCEVIFFYFKPSLIEEFVLNS